MTNQISEARSGLPRRDAHIPVLDGVRGVAVLGVLVYHFWQRILEQYPGWPPGALRVFEFASFGAKGVDLFFVLSGFLITGILLRSKGTKHYFRNFYARRSLRIFPLYYLTVTACLIVGTVAAIPDYQWRTMVWYFFYLHNVRDAFWQPRLGGPGWFWSLAVEEHFYLFWPLIVSLLRKRWLIVFSLGLMVVAPTVRTYFIARDANLFFTLCRMDSLAAGSILAVLFSAPAYWEKTVTWVRRLALPVAILALGLSLRYTGTHGHPLVETFKYTLFALLCSVVLVLALSPGKLNPLPAIGGMKWLRGMGKTSYSMYVLHPFLYTLTIGVIYHASWSPVRGMRWLDAVLDLAIALGATVLVSKLTWVLIESPILRLKDRFRYEKRVEGQKAGSDGAMPLQDEAMALSPGTQSEAS